MPRSFLVVLTTLPNLPDARRISKLILKKRLAACINQIGPVRSTYWWKRKVETATEYLLLIKTRKAHFSRLKTLLEAHHPYSVPEIVALPVEKGNASYLKWLETET